MEQTMNLLKTEVYSKASRDEFQSIQVLLPNLMTKQDQEIIFDSLKDKMDLKDVNGIKGELSSLRENSHEYCKLKKFDNKVRDIEDKLIKFYDQKSEKSLVREKFSELKSLITFNQAELEKYKE